MMYFSPDIVWVSGTMNQGTQAEYHEKPRTSFSLKAQAQNGLTLRKRTAQDRARTREHRQTRPGPLCLSPRQASSDWNHSLSCPRLGLRQTLWFARGQASDGSSDLPEPALGSPLTTTLLGFSRTTIVLQMGHGACPCAHAAPAGYGTHRSTHSHHCDTWPLSLWVWLVAPWSAIRDGGPVQAQTIPDETMHLRLFGCKWV